MWTTHFAESAVQQHQRNGSAHVPAGTPWRSGSERYRDLCDGSGIRIEEFASLKLVCIITASLRATATAALLKPILSRFCLPDNVRFSPKADLRRRRQTGASHG
jgi:hypothetical protein